MSLNTSLTTEYADFVIEAGRLNKQSVEIRVSSSPAGVMKKPGKVSFPAAEAETIFQRFHVSVHSTHVQHTILNQEEATALGKRLAQILFIRPVFKIFTESLARMVRKPGAGLRIRLVLDESLTDLPWEYLYRPDRLLHEGISGFLLLDPTISLVRGKVNPKLNPALITGQQQLTFVGALWDREEDRWEVKKEYDLLQYSLASVKKFINGKFIKGSDIPAKKSIAADTAIFHYAGHCDVDEKGKSFAVLEMKEAYNLLPENKWYVQDMAKVIGRAAVRLVVLSACNSGYRNVIEPILQKGIPAVIGINGIVTTQSTIEFCTRLYESLSVGLTLDEAVNRARMHVVEWSAAHDMFDWGLYMVYMPSAQSVLFPRKETATSKNSQQQVRKGHAAQIGTTLQLAQQIDGLNFGEIMSELSKHRVLILGRFKERRLKILEAIKQYLAEHPNQYIPELFTYDKPHNRDLVESIIGFAALSRFIIADISERSSIPSELEAIVPHFLSVPVVPIINKTGKPYATFEGIVRRENVIKPLLRYDNLEDLLQRLDKEVVSPAENKIQQLQNE